MTAPAAAQGNGAAPVVAVTDLRIRFVQPDRTIHAVNGLDFALARGEILTVIGESGSGKSVMLRALLGLLPAHARWSGRVVLAGQDIGGLPPAALERLRGRIAALVFQEPSTALDPVYTIGSQIAETIIRHEGVAHREAWRRAEGLLDLVAIPSAARRLRNYPHELSGGMRQRAMIALALACRPSVLLADEPTTALDATVQIQLLLLFRRLQQELGMAVIFVTHDMGVAAEISDRVAVMYAGRFVETGPVESVLLRPRHPYTRGLLRSIVQAEMRGRPLQTIAGAPPDLALEPQGCAFSPRCGHALPDCTIGLPHPIAGDPGQTVWCKRANTLHNT